MKTLKKIILWAGLMLPFLSCEDFLEEKGYNADYTYYKTADGLDALVASCYQQTRWCAGFETQYALEDMGTDIYMLGGDGSHRDAFGQYLSSALTPTNQLLLDFWNNNYKGIASCNLALQYADVQYRND